MSDLVENLTTKSAMIELGEKIAWGSDTALMREAAARIEALEAELKAAEAREARLREAVENCLQIIDALQRESGREIEYGAEDPFRMGEWFEDVELKAIADARAALAETDPEAHHD